MTGQNHIRIAVITDLHWQSYDPGRLAQQQGYFADIMLLRAVHRLNRFVKPDVVLILGDLLDAPNAAAAPRQLAALRNILNKLTAPVIVIPGNHDPVPDVFYRTMPRPPAWLDIKGVRFLPFIDQQTEKFNARRNAADILRMAAARHNFDGVIVTLQHVPLFPPDAHACPYRYDNADEIMQAMHASGIDMAISGHYHAGFQLTSTGPVNAIAAPALCEAPFRFLTVDLADDQTTVVEHALANPRALALTDYHVHTPYAYCNENMDICQSLKLGRLFGLEHIVFSEHSGQLYHPAPDYWSGRFLAADAVMHSGNDRLTSYFDDVRQYAGDYAMAGLELDCDYSGRPVIRPAHRNMPCAPIGAIHFLEGLRKPALNPAKIEDEFLGMVSRLTQSGIISLAHPLRIFQKAGLPVPTALFPALADLLRARGVAAELNFHTNTPAPEFFRLCIERGIKITLGSDAHNLYEVGEFFPHLQFLRHACGYDGDLKDILLDFQQARAGYSSCNFDPYLPENHLAQSGYGVR